jgi:ubiquinol-cytochrome c reductase cytochrome c1 subunit
MRILKTLVLAAAFPAVAFAAGGHVALDRAPIDNHDTASLQRGAKLFVNYCMGCHGAQYMRYNRLTDLGITEEQIKDNLMFNADKVGEPMRSSMDAKAAAKWFGAQPPDLSVVARSRGADWLYTYLRTYYRDDSRATGWNNLAFPNVGMPHVLWELQGTQELEAHEGSGDGHGASHAAPSLKLVSAGAMPPKQYDAAAADLVNFLVYLGEPARTHRVQLGMLVLLFLGVLFVVAYPLKKEFWKDIH